jgi:hypothetical protein
MPGHFKSGEVKWLPGGYTHTLTNSSQSPAKFVTLEFNERWRFCRSSRPIATMEIVRSNSRPRTSTTRVGADALVWPVEHQLDNSDPNDLPVWRALAAFLAPGATYFGFLDEGGWNPKKHPPPCTIPIPML